MKLPGSSLAHKNRVAIVQYSVNCMNITPAVLGMNTSKIKALYKLLGYKKT